MSGSVVPPNAAGDSVNLLNCDREPVHIPGCIQPFGAVVVARRAELRVVQASANLQEWIGVAPHAVLGRGLETAFGPDRAGEITRVAASGQLEQCPTRLFGMSAGDSARSVVVAAHTLGEHVLFEIEPDDGLDPAIYAALNAVIARLQGGGGLADYCDRVAAEVRSLTGFDRVMVYRFHPDHSGEVAAEAARPDLPSYLGLRYPAADIPAPAREMYRRVWVRVMPDISRPSIPLVPAVPHFPPTDLTYCYLRGVSPIHVEYLTNMGVTASMSLSLLRDGVLWGLIACHHYSPRHLSGKVRAACEVVARVASLQLAAAEARDNAGYRSAARLAQDAMVTRASVDGVPLTTLVDGNPGLMDLVPCGGVALRFQGKWTVRGSVPPVAALEAFSLWLAEGERGELFTSDQIGSAYPPANDWASVAAGILAARLSPNRPDVLLWVRPEAVQTVRWAGDPNDKPVLFGPHGPRLHPRKSFEIWQETVRGRSAPWTQAEVEEVSRLRLAVLEVVVAHGERLARLNQQLAASNEELDSFAYVASHDLKEPLRGIFNHAQSLLDAPNPAETSRQRAEAVLRLTRRMENLIESLLHYSRVGRLELNLTEVDFNEALSEVLDTLSVRIAESGTEVRVPRPLPTIRCDYVRARELLLNLVGNAVKYNDKPVRWVEVGFADPDPARPGPIRFHVKDNGIGIKAKFFEQIFTIFKRLHGRDEFGGGSGAGLTIARRIVERHGGCMWIESVPGEGSAFYFTLASEEAAT